MHSRHLIAGAFAALVLIAHAAGAQATGTTAKPKAKKHQETEADLQKLATITRDSATIVALAEVPGGAVKSSEIEREKKHLVYSFDISVEGKTGIEEILVDAKSGKIISHEHETPTMEKAEARKEAKEKAAKKP